ncbi:MAG: RNA polymerase-binding ATPase, partial [bacterium]|nr:RNA polymerase-binding ATPase [Candidatus Kapabacteria bacterium]
ASFGIWKSKGDERLYLELNAIIECVAPPALHVDRFLPPTPVRVVVDSAREDATGDHDLASASLRDGDISRVLNRVAVKTALVPAMLDTAMDIATHTMDGLVASASKAMNAQLQHEIDRLEDLHQINSDVDLEEISAMREHKSALQDTIASARLRVDALRLILRTP